MTQWSLILRYGAFAAVAVAVNLAVQRGVLGLSLGLLAALIAGTAAGLIVKYLLDKLYIFNDPTTDMVNEGWKFTLYTTMGLITTVIFWGTEWAAWTIWQTDAAREGGALLGLGVGYVVKYRLDRRFVFDRGLAA